MIYHEKKIIGNTTLRKHDELGWELCMQEYTNKQPHYTTYTGSVPRAYGGPIEMGGCDLQKIYDFVAKKIDRETIYLEKDFIKDNDEVLAIHKKHIGRYQEYADFLSSYISQQGSKK